MSSRDAGRRSAPRDSALSRRNILLGGTTIAAASALAAPGSVTTAQAQPQAPVTAAGRRPNILVIFGDDVGLTNVSAYSLGLMGYRTPNIDRIAKEGMMTMPSRAARRGGRPSSPARRRCAPASPRWGCRPPTSACASRTSRLRRRSSRWAMPPASSARTIWATATSSCPRCTGSTSSSATSITSMPRRSRASRLSQGPAFPRQVRAPRRAQERGHHHR